MNASLRDLRRQADQLTPPSFDIDDIVARGEVRLGRRRAGLAAGTAGLVVAALVAGASYAGSSKQSNQPIDQPTPSVTETSGSNATRRLTYADVPGEQAPNWRIHTIQYGSRRCAWARSCTWTSPTMVWRCSPRTAPSTSLTAHRLRRSAARASRRASATPMLKAADAGSLVAWFTPAVTDPSLVVYETVNAKWFAQIRVPGASRASVAS